MLRQASSAIPGTVGPHSHGRSDDQTLNIVLIGPPGSGKGTQATRICGRYRVPLISTGDTLRSAAKEGVPLGREVNAIMASGGLVSDALMIDLMRERLIRDDAAAGFVLDGFPRTIVQAQALDGMLGGRRVLAIVLTVPEAELERRLSARRVCNACNTLYTTATRYDGSEEEQCARCGVALIRRDDDNAETIARRLLTYRDFAGPLIEHYQQRSAIALIDGSMPADEVWSSIISKIDHALAWQT